MDFRRVVDPQGLNWWTVVSGMGMNFVLTSFLFLALTAFVDEETSPLVYSLAMCVGAFAIPLLTAYVCGRLSDERYMTYAFYPLVGFLVLAVPGILVAGAFGLLIVGFGVLGALNGGALAARRAMRRRRGIYGADEPRKDKGT